MLSTPTRTVDCHEPHSIQSPLRVWTGVFPRSVQEAASMTMARLGMRGVGAWALALALSLPNYGACREHRLRGAPSRACSKQTPLIDGHKRPSMGDPGALQEPVDRRST